jgi:hypothetical protein
MLSLPKKYFNHIRVLIIGFVILIIALSSLGKVQKVKATSTLITGITSFWKLDEASGTRSDSVGSNNLTDNNTVGQAIGKVGSAAQFNSASSRYLSIADNASLSTGDIDFTWSGWVYLDSKTTNRVFVHKGSGVSNGQYEYLLFYNSTANRFRFAASNSGGAEGIVNANTLGSPSIATWYFIVAWHDSVANTVNIQVNDGTVDSVSYSGGAQDSSSALNIGRANASGLPMDGRIDAVGFWKRTLTTAERTELYNSGLGVEYPFGPPPDPAPTITSVSADKSDGTYGVGEVIDIDVTFSEAVTSTGNVTVTLETGATDRTCTFTVTNATTGTCNYTVQSGDTTTDLNVNSVNGTIQDQASQLMTDFNPVTNLSANKNIFINTDGSNALLNSLAAYWKLDEASGTRADILGTSDLSDNNSVGQTNGMLGYAAQFNGITQSLSHTDSATLSTGDIDFTIAGWVNLSSKSSIKVIAAKYDTSVNQREYLVWYDNTSDRFRISVSSTGLSNAATTVSANNFGSPSTGTWYFITAWHDAGANTANIQVNNGPVDSASHFGGVLNSTSTFRIGANSEDIQFFSGSIDAVGIWKRILTPTDKTTLYNAGAGNEYPFDGSVSGSVISISTPKSYQVIQRNGSNQATISITGTYAGSVTPSAIEASWNGAPYATIISNPSGGAFSGSLTNQSTGQGTLTVRFVDNTSITASRTYVGIGDVFVIAGQSNASGRGTNNQSYSHASLKAGLFRNNDSWGELTDPTDSSSGQVDSISSDTATGSVWPLIATLYMADQGVPVAFIPTAKGATNITQWQRNNSNPSDTTTLYGSMYRRINVVGNVKGILFWQGESDALDGTSQSVYKTKLETFANNAFSDFGIKTVVAQIGDFTTQPGPNVDNVRLGQIDAWNDGGNVLVGPSLYDVNTSDYVHFESNSELQIAANRWWAAIKRDYYSGTDGRGPRLTAAEYNSAKTFIRLTFTDESLPILPTSGLSGFTVKDNGTPVTISSVTRVSNNQLQILLSSAAVGTLTVSLGEGHSGKGAVVPTDSSTYNLPAETFVNHATTALDQIAPVTTNLGIDTSWHNSDVTITLNCTDVNGSGCATTYHTTDGTTPTISSTQGTSLNITTDGIYTIKYFSVDVEGNQEPVKTATNTVKIDKTNPSVNAGTDKTADSVVSQDATVTDNSSGIATYSWTKVSGPGTITFGTANIEDTTLSADVNGIYVIRLTVTDLAGNIGYDEMTLVWYVSALTPTSTPTITITPTAAPTLTSIPTEDPATVTIVPTHVPKESSNLFTASIKVQDEDGNFIKSTNVLLESKEFGTVEGTTDENGIVTFSNVKKGDYKISLDYEGKHYEKNITISSNFSVQNPFEMKVNKKERQNKTNYKYILIVTGTISIILLGIFKFFNRRQNSSF